jgi:hypothetical protein
MPADPAGRARPTGRAPLPGTAGRWPRATGARRPWPGYNRPPGCAGARRRSPRGQRGRQPSSASLAGRLAALPVDGEHHSASRPSGSSARAGRYPFLLAFPGGLDAGCRSMLRTRPAARCAAQGRPVTTTRRSSRGQPGPRCGEAARLSGWWRRLPGPHGRAQSIAAHLLRGELECWPRGPIDTRSRDLTGSAGPKDMVRIRVPALAAARRGAMAGRMPCRGAHEQPRRLSLARNRPVSGLRHPTGRPSLPTPAAIAGATG